MQRAIEIRERVVFVNEPVGMGCNGLAQLVFMIYARVEDRWNLETAGADLLEQADTVETRKAQIRQEYRRTQYFTELQRSDAIRCFAGNVKAALVPQDKAKHVLNGNIILGEQHSGLHTTWERLLRQDGAGGPDMQ